MKVERPFAYCCAEAGGRVEACDCVNKDHGTAWFEVRDTSSPPVVEEGRREAATIARQIIASVPISAMVGQLGWSNWEAAKRGLTDAIVALDAILALTPVEGVGEPVAYRHTLNMEGGQTMVKLSEWDGNSALEPRVTAFGIPGRDYSEEYSVTTEPLYLSTPVAAQGDEVREALKCALETLDHIIRLTENEPDEHPVSLATRLLPIRQAARGTLRDLAALATLGAPHEG